MKALQFSVTVPKFIAAKGLAAIFGKRVYYQGPLKTIQIADIPEPTLPTKDWVKIKTIYCGFCGSDLNLIQLLRRLMFLIFPSENPTAVVFIKRNTYNGPHSAQVSFPGGAWEPSDESMEQTAVRETREELGITGEIHLLGSLTQLHIPVSNFIVTPIAGWMEQRPVYHPDPLEVQYVIESSLEELFDPANILSDHWEQHGRTIVAPYYRVGKEKIWGATAMMLCEFLQVASRLP